MTIVTKYEECLEQGITLFNEGKFFEAHEAWEPLWLSAEAPREKQFLQGLIMLAGAFLHYIRRECVGASALLERSSKALAESVNDHPEIRLPDFLGEVDRLRTAFDRCQLDVRVEDLPKISSFGRPFVQRQVY
jgi:predicted metal-dependent hydrolase